MDWKKYKSNCVVNYYKIEKLDWKCIEYGYKEGSINHLFNSFLLRKLNNSLNKNKNNKNNLIRIIKYN